MPRSWTSADRRWTLAAILLGVGALLVVGVRLGEGPPVLPPDTAAPPAAQSPPPEETSVPRAAGAAQPVGPPAWLEIPSLDVRTSLLELGLRSDGAVEVPTTAEADRAGWYRHSPSPGETGPAVVIGHLDSNSGPAVFYRLSELAPDDLVKVGGGDGSVVEFRVTRVEQYHKRGFPTDTVYGDTTGPELRLITCGGWYDDSGGGYQDNVVVFATLATDSDASHG